MQSPERLPGAPLDGCGWEMVKAQVLVVGNPAFPSPRAMHLYPDSCPQLNKDPQQATDTPVCVTPRSPLKAAHLL